MLAGVQEGGAAQLPVCRDLSGGHSHVTSVMQQPAYPQQSGEDTEVCSETLQVSMQSVFVGVAECLDLPCTRNTAELRPYRTEQVGRAESDVPP